MCDGNGSALPNIGVCREDICGVGRYERYLVRRLCSGGACWTRGWVFTRRCCCCDFTARRCCFCRCLLLRLSCCGSGSDVGYYPTRWEDISVRLPVISYYPRGWHCCVPSTRHGARRTIKSCACRSLTLFAQGCRNLSISVHE